MSRWFKKANLKTETLKRGSAMPHPELGRVGWLLGGMGCIGITQAVQIREFWNAGIRPDQIDAVSVGVCNGFDPPRAAKIWEESFNYPWDIFDLNPELQEIAEKFLKYVPRKPRSPFHKHGSWKELVQDFREWPRELVRPIGFASYIAVRTFLFAFWAITKRNMLFPEDKPLSHKDFTSFLQFVVSEASRKNLTLPESFFGFDPLMSKLRGIINAEGVLRSPITFHIITRSGAEEHIFETGASSSPEIVDKIKAKKKPVDFHRIESEEELFDACQAAIALPPFFRRMPIGEYLYWDVGTVNPFPVEYLLDSGCDTIFAFVRDYWTRPPRPKRGDKYNFIDSLIENAEAEARASFFDKYEKATARAEREGKKIHIIHHQELHPDLGLLWISPEAIEHTIKIETEAAKDRIQKILKLS